MSEDAQPGAEPPLSAGLSFQPGSTDYTDLIENADDAIYATDLPGNFLYVNRGTERITGYSRDELLELNIDDLLASDEALRTSNDHFQRKLDGDIGLTRYEVSIRTRAGDQVTIDVQSRLIMRDGEPVGVQGIARDVTESKRLERRMQDAQRLESLAILAGGVAHDFNNLLMSILGNAGLALTSLPPDSTARESLEAIEITAIRARELTNQMLAYSGKGRFILQRISLDVLTADMLPILKAVVGPAIVIVHRPGGEEGEVEGDPSQLRQVLLNLVINASDAMAGQPGEITVATDVVSAGREPDVLRRMGLGGRPHARLCVTDRGSGIDEEARERIFDPFFSTKGAGRGLGLAALQGIVRGHRGGVSVSSTPGEGSTFTVAIPLAD